MKCKDFCLTITIQDKYRKSSILNKMSEKAVKSAKKF